MIFSHVLYHLSYPAAWGGSPRGKPVLILEYGARVIKGCKVPSGDLKGWFRVPRLPLGEAVELEGGFEHLLG